MNAVAETPRASATITGRVAADDFSLVDSPVELPKRIADEVVANDLTAGLRVTFVNRYFYPDMSATSQMLYDLARRLVKQGVVVSVVCSRQLYEDAQAALPSEETIEGIKVYRIKTTRFGRNQLVGRGLDYLSFYASAVKKLLSITQPGDVLVAKTDPPLISLAVAAVAKLRNARLVNWLQDLFPEVAAHLGQRLPTWLEGMLVRMRDWSLQAASANVVIGTRMRDLLLKQGIAASKIHVVENWADGDFVESKPVNASALRTALCLQKKFVVGYSGNLGRAHEYETLLSAASALRHERDVVFLMIGGGNKMQALKQSVGDQQLNNFVFLPYQPRNLLADSMAASDVHLTSLQPSLEGLIVPSKFYGILAAGRPSIVIGDTDGELARIVRREGCGEAISVGDWDSLVSAIWHMKLEPVYRQRLATRARTVFLERHTADRGAEQWLQVLVAVHESHQQAAASLAVVRA